MALTTRPQPADLRQVFSALGMDPATATFIASGNVTEPRGYVVPRCQINVVPSGTVPMAAAARLGVRSSQMGYRVTLLHTQRASPGTNTAVFLTRGVYETNFTFDAEGFAAQRDVKNPANHLERWTNPEQNRVYFVMPEELSPLNESAEREHCLDFIHAYELTLQAVDSAFQALNRTTMEGYLSMQEAREAMIKRVGESLAPALRAIACDPGRLEGKFKDLLRQSRDGRDGRGWHSFGVEFLDQPPRVHPGISYLTGAQRPESGRVYLGFTRGQTQINMHPSNEVIRL